MEPALVALDVGTSSVRAGLFRAGRLAASSRGTLDIAFPSPGHAEQDPREIWDCARAVLEESLAHLDQGEPAALGLTCQRSTVVAWDSETGRPFGPALSWRDSRARAKSDRLARLVPDLKRRTGLPASPHYGAPKIAWLLEHWEPARRAAEAGTLRVGPPSSWLTWQLTRGEAFVVDATNAQRMLLLDLTTLEWDQEIVEACGVPAEALPRVLPTDAFFGEAHVGGRVLPLRASLGDQQAALLGQSGAEALDDDAVVQLGTGGFVLRDVGDELVHVDGLLTGIARADVNKPRRYLVEGPVNSAGSALDRLRDLGLLAPGEDVDAACALAASPVTAVPAWAGLGAPWWESGARGALLGLDESTTRADVVAGTVLGIAFLVADVVDALSRGGLAVRELRLSGPLSSLESVGRAIADATGRAASAGGNPEASLEGIALALARACDATPPALSLEPARRHEPGRDLSALRERFSRARDAAIAWGRPGAAAPS